MNEETKKHIGSELLAKREAIASRLRKAREAAGLSQGQVARMMRLHRPTVSEIEAGRRRISAEEMTEMASLYGVSVGWLSCSDTSEVDPVEDHLMLAARNLARLKPEDLNRLLNLLQTMRQSSENQVQLEQEDAAAPQETSNAFRDASAGADQETT